MHEAKIFPKLFIGKAADAFKQFLKNNNYNYTINYVIAREDLINLIDVYSRYKNYTLPVIISDISYFNKNDQSLLLKFIDDSKLNIILLASRDNILDTIISRVKEFRKYYIFNNNDKAGFISLSKAREMFNNDIGSFSDDTLYDDKLLIYNKYNPALSYDDMLVSKFCINDKKKLLDILEYSNE